MKIILLRHGKPNVDMKTKVSLDKMFSWIQTYDNSKVNESCPLFYWIVYFLMIFYSFKSITKSIGVVRYNGD